jgi:hypothetical protein
MVGEILERSTHPLEHVQDVEADPEIEHTLWRGWRIPGVHLPGIRFYDVHGRRDKTIVIYLKDENYDRFIVKVQDPVEVVTKTNEALDAERSSLSRTRANKPGNGLHLGTKAA